MANTIKLRRSATAGSVPTTGNLALGELAMNTADGKLFMKTDDGAGTVGVAEIGAGGSITIASSPPAGAAAGDIYWDQDDGSAYIYYIDADSTAQWVPLTPLADTPIPGSDAQKIDDISGSFNGTLTDFTINVNGSAHEPVYINATIISLGGVIQEPTTAYTISGSTISFATAPSSGLDFFGIDCAVAVAIGTPNDGTVTPAKLSTGGPNWDSSGRLLAGTSSTSKNLRALFQGNSTGAADEPTITLFAANTATPTGGLGLLRFSDNAHNFSAEIGVYRDGGTWTSGSSHPTRLVFSTTADSESSPTERIRIDSSGNVGIGKTSSGNKLEIEGQGDTVVVIDGRTDAANGSYAALQLWSKNSGGANNFGFVTYDGDGNFEIGSAGNGAGSVPLMFKTNNTERMTISGNGSGIFQGIFRLNSGAYVGTETNTKRLDDSSHGSSSATLFIGNASIQVSSDARLKENIEDTNLDALSAIQQIDVKDFTWNDPSDTSFNNRNARGKWTGLIAQELVEILPFIVNAPRKESDGSIDHDSEETWTLDQSQLCPVLIKAMQQQQEIITALEQRLTDAGL